MTRGLWKELQSFVSGVGLDDDAIHAMMVFQAIRGLGKVKELQRVFTECDGPETLVMHVMSAKGHLVPSVASLNTEGRILLERLFRLHSKFNFAQMQQGENVPSSVVMLKDALKEL